MSDAELSQVLSELKESARQLNEASDEINEIIASIERQIIDAKVGLEVWLTLEEGQSYEDDDTKPPTTRRFDIQLGFAKIQEGWALAIKEVDFSHRILQQIDTTTTFTPTELSRGGLEDPLLGPPAN